MYMQNGGEGETVCYLFSPKGDDYMRGEMFFSWEMSGQVLPNGFLNVLD